MPRKKIDREAEILIYFETEPLPQVSLMGRLIKGVLAKRAGAEAEAQKAAVPVKKVVRRRVRKPVPVIPAAEIQQVAAALAPAAPAPAPRRRRRMRADSPPPVSEATPIVPLASQVGDDVPGTYEGN
jgi:hypothetical protein